jgi:DNA-directed RNA polymerase subunit RPC12/RpoP
MDLEDAIVDYHSYVSHFVDGVAMPGETYLDYLRNHYSKLTGSPLPAPPSALEVPKVVEVWINSGRWVWRCINCSTGVWADRTYEYTICVKCGHGGWRRQVWPKDQDRIEGLLLQRKGWRELSPDRNWLLDETIPQLEAENILLGVG